LTAQASAIHPPQRDAVGAAFVLLAGFGAWLRFGENFLLLQWLGFFVVVVAIFQFEKLSRSPA